MAKLQRETDVANVLSQMSQLVHQPSDNGSGINKDDQEHTYAQTLSTVNDRSSFNTSSNTVNKATVKGRFGISCLTFLLISIFNIPWKYCYYHCQIDTVLKFHIIISTLTVFLARNSSHIIHSLDRKKHVCEKCGRCFSKLCNLKSHLRVHNGERPFSCDLCSKAFTNYWDLRRHCRTHSGEKPYKVDAFPCFLMSADSLKEWYCSLQREDMVCWRIC